MDTVLLLCGIMTLLIVVPYNPTGAWCDFDQKTQYEEKPCMLWQMPPAMDENPGFVVQRAGRLPWQLQPQVNDSFGNYVGKLYFEIIN